MHVISLKIYIDEAREYSKIRLDLFQKGFLNMKFNKVGFIGLGLIGGSIAKKICDRTPRRNRQRSLS